MAGQVVLSFPQLVKRNRLDLMSNAVIPAKAGAFRSDVVQYKNQIPPNPPFFMGGIIGKFFS
jgi:hypothetical protein